MTTSLTRSLTGQVARSGFGYRGPLVRRAACIAVAAGMLGVTAPPALAYECVAFFVQADATSKTLWNAQSQAKKNWSAKVQAAHGLPWSVWDIAATQNINCSNVGAGQRKCVAMAKPCKYVVQ